MERSVYIIKPEGMPHRQEIRQMIQAAGLAVIGSTATILPQEVLAKLYPDLQEERGELWIATLDHLAHSECEVGIVEGENAVQRLSELCGTATSPHDCGLETIRARFGRGIAAVRAGKKLYWKNIIHRSKNLEEARGDLEIAYKLITLSP